MNGDWFIEETVEKLQEIDFDVLGILTKNDSILTLGTDSKIIGRIFEMFTQPVLESVAFNHDYVVETPASQTVYPDFILLNNSHPKEKIAVDVKTTYIPKPGASIKYTLGSYGSYMRNGTKNIAYNYSDFSKHYVIGFVYRRNDSAQSSKLYRYAERDQIQFPFCDVSYFVQEKYKIAGDKPGSGNTENIGSFSSSDLSLFANGKGPFNSLGVDIFNLYWSNYPKYREEKTYTSLEEFADWLPNNIQSIKMEAYDGKTLDKEHVLKQLDKYLKSL